MAYRYAAYAEDRRNGSSEAINFTAAVWRYQLIDASGQTWAEFLGRYRL
jgi:hypothetical protein